jgi:hypothetical protein
MAGSLPGPPAESTVQGEPGKPNRIATPAFPVKAFFMKRGRSANAMLATEGSAGRMGMAAVIGTVWLVCGFIGLCAYKSNRNDGFSGTDLYMCILGPIMFLVALASKNEVITDRRAPEPPTIPAETIPTTNAQEKYIDTHLMSCKRCGKDTDHFLVTSPKALPVGGGSGSRWALNHYYLACVECKTPSREISKLQAQALRKKA